MYRLDDMAIRSALMNTLHHRCVYCRRTLPMSRFARLGTRQSLPVVAAQRRQGSDGIVELNDQSECGEKNGSLMEGVGRLGCLLACMLVLQQQLEVPVAYADDSNLSAYEKRKIENEKRKEMLRSLREKAEQGASKVDAPPVYAPSAAPSVPTIVSPPVVAVPKKEDSPSSPFGSKGSSPDASSSSLSMPKMDMPKMPSFSFGGGDGNKEEEAPPPPAPKPVVPVSPPSLPKKPVVVPPPPPPPPAPAPIPEPVKKYTPPQVVMPSTPKASSQGDTLEQWRQQQKKDLETRKKVERQAEVNRHKAKKGAMPMWLAEFLLIGSFVGFGFASVVFGSQIAALYKKVDDALTNASFTK